MTNAKISVSQGVLLLFLTRLFSLLAYKPIFNTSTEGRAVLYGTLLAVVIEALLLVPAILLSRRSEGENVLEIAYRKTKPIGIILILVYAGTILAGVVGSVVNFEFFMTNAAFPDASNLVIILSICLVCFFCVRFGLEGLARTGGFVFIFLCLCFILIVAVSFKSMNLFNLNPMLNDPVTSVWNEAVKHLGESPELFLFVLMMPLMQGSKTKGVASYLVLVLFFSELISFMSYAILGPLMDMLPFPFLTLTAIVDVLTFQRLDIIHLVIWVFLSFLRITLFLYLFNRLLQAVIPEKWRRYTIPVCFVAVTGISVFVSNRPDILTGMSVYHPILIAVLTFAIPLLFLPFTKKKEVSA